jgi:hypothetical protein
MAKKFGDTKGSAIKNSPDAYKYKDGENIVRLVGDVLPRYVYWVKGTNDKDIPIECLSFDREKEKFTNKETDHVQDYFPEKKCSWAYAMNCLVDGKIVVLNLKKKLFEQIISASEDLGDPTDPDAGWDINFKRVKTGPLAFNVEYTLNVLRCKPRALSEDERSLIAAATPIEQLVPRATSADIKSLLDRITKGDTPDEGGADDAAKEAIADL